MEKLINNIYKKSLWKIIDNKHLNEGELGIILNKARESRNYIAHDLCKGLDCLLDSVNDNHFEFLFNDLKDKINDIAEADKTICFLISKLTNEILPNNDFLKSYNEKILNWVFEI